MTYEKNVQGLASQARPGYAQPTEVAKVITKDWPWVGPCRVQMRKFDRTREIEIC